jgi:hypothetical protein
VTGHEGGQGGGASPGDLKLSGVTLGAKEKVGGVKVENQELGAEPLHVRWVRFLFCWQVAHPFTYCSIHRRAPGHENFPRTFLVVSSQPGWPTSPSWYACMILLLSVSLGGTMVRPSSIVHRVVPSACRPPCSMSHPECLLCSCTRRYSKESSFPVLAKLRKVSDGRRVIFLSSCWQSSSLGLNRASAGVLFFP